VYLAEICLIGLFALKAAIGPLILMVIFLIFTVLFHLTLSEAVDPLLRFLPKSLQSVEEHLLTAEYGDPNTAVQDGLFPTVDATKNTGESSTTGAVAKITAPLKKVGFLAKFLHPEKYTNYLELRKLIPREGIPEICYTPEEEQNAYYHPALQSTPPVLWFPRDVGGVSAQECEHTGRVIGCSDDGAVVDEVTGKMMREDENSAPPSWTLDPIY